jgi:hypothetical protein
MEPLLWQITREVTAGKTLGHLPDTFPAIFWAVNLEHREAVRGELERVYPAVLANMILERACLPA